MRQDMPLFLFLQTDNTVDVGRNKKQLRSLKVCLILCVIDICIIACRSILLILYACHTQTELN